jgi:hypothetical protein
MTLAAYYKGRSKYKVVTTDINENKGFNKHMDLNKKNQAYNSEKGKNSIRYQYSVYEDEEDYDRQNKTRKNSDNKVKNHITEDVEISDKLETIKRLEREKHAVQKKSREEVVERKKKPVLKQKRSSRDWTKDYQNGLLDEEVFL